MILDVDDRLLTTTEVATMLRLNKKTVQRWCAKGKLPHIKTLGGGIRIRVGDANTIFAPKYEGN
jgi:excisionase family DNA binding protein